MADDIDVAQEQQQRLHDARIQDARARAGQLEVKATGYCLSCGEPLAAGLRFCDTDCRDDYQKINRMRGR